MARLPRFILPDYPQHVIQRGSNAQRILFDEADYWFLWERLGAGATKFHCDIHAYVLMPSHLHLVVTPRTLDGIGKMMQYVGVLVTLWGVAVLGIWGRTLTQLPCSKL